jgi:hypothetical protein
MAFSRSQENSTSAPSDRGSAGIERNGPRPLNRGELFAPVGFGNELRDVSEGRALAAARTRLVAR